MCIPTAFVCRLIFSKLCVLCKFLAIFCATDPLFSAPP